MRTPEEIKEQIRKFEKTITFNTRFGLHPNTALLEENVRLLKWVLDEKETKL